MVQDLTPTASQVEELIYLIRGEKVMLDKDLAALYRVDTRALVQAVKRNSERFPEDFCFQLSNQEFASLRSQIVISNRGGRRIAPYVFTEQGVAILSGVLHSSAAIQANVEIMRTFVRLRKFIAANNELAKKLDNLEKRYDSQFKLVFDAIREIMNPAQPPARRTIGFGRNSETERLP
ncbi:MAG: ORF6N domain-containing protein [Deltaproteobacteria bacterium]|nr:ORF6N domain-containing protein [Deltaproteobacteria bacterium]